MVLNVWLKKIRNVLFKNKKSDVKNSQITVLKLEPTLIILVLIEY